MKSLKSAKCKLTVGLLCFSQSVMAFTPSIQSTLFNAALKDIGTIQQERLISYTQSLYKTLNAEESTALIGHQYLKISSYMFLAEFWQTYSLEKVLSERGVAIPEEDLNRLGIQTRTYRTPMNQAGPLNLAFNQVTTGQCTRSNNQPFAVNYQEVYNAILKIKNYLQSLDSPTIAAQSAMLYLKAYFYLRLHAPNSLYTYVNSDCISDVNGLLTCANDWVAFDKPSIQHIERVRGYMNYDLDNYNINESMKNELMNCTVTLWHYIQSGGITEPLTDGQIIAASEALFSDVDHSYKYAAQNTGFERLMVDARDIMNFIYFPKSYGIKEGTDPKSLVRSILLNQMKMASLRLSVLMNSDPLLKPKPQ